MNTSASSQPRSLRVYVPTTALAKSLDFDKEMMHVTLTDGRKLSVPLTWFPALQETRYVLESETWLTTIAKQ